MSLSPDVNGGSTIRLFSPYYSRLMVRGAVAAILDTPATPLPLLRSLMAAAGPYVLGWEWSGGRRTS